MTKRIFRSIFLAALCVLLAALTLVMGALHAYFTGIQMEQLRVETALASHAVTNEGASYFDTLDDTMGCRITWISVDGTVLYDNRTDSGSMENHMERQEVKSAMVSGYGHSSRFSDTLMEQYIYAAERLPDGSVLRLSTSRSSILNLLLDLSWTIVLVVIAAVVLSYILARRLSESIVRPLNTLDLDEPLSNSVYPEIYPLLLRMDSQKEQLLANARQLRQKQKEFNTVTRSLEEGLVLVNSSGTILSINPAAARLLDVTQNCLGADFTVANRNREISRLMEKALDGQKGEATVSLTGGNYLAAASPVKSGGQLSGVVLLLFDVTQKHQAEHLRREFTANVSHELKTPLHAISGYAELMKSGLVPSADVPAFSEKIYGEAQRMVRLVEDTLRLSRLDEGAADLQWTEVSLSDTVLATIQELSGAAELQKVSLRFSGDSVRLRAIPQLVSAIVFNLADNAVKYSHPGGVVELRVQDNSDAVILTVADTGIGIPPEHQGRIFERFYRVDKSHSKAVGGTGLGLSIVKHAALILNASIVLDSAPDIGTTVTVRFQKS